MGCYFFAVRNHVDFRDHTGQVFPGPKEAIRYAEIMARELARLQHLHGASLEVTDEQGNLLSKKAIQPPFAPEQIDLKRHDNGDGGLALWGRGPFEIPGA
jgi:hypothetical protein